MFVGSLLEVLLRDLGYGVQITCVRPVRAVGRNGRVMWSSARAAIVSHMRM